MQLRSLQSPSQASDQTVMAIAGHVSRQMLEHYSHVRLEAKRRAVEALSQRGDNGSYVTNNVTNGECGDIAQDATHRKDWSALADDFRTLLVGTDLPSGSSHVVATDS